VWNLSLDEPRTSSAVGHMASPSEPLPAGVSVMDSAADLTARSNGAQGFAWGFVSQGFSSATNLGLSLLAARVLGPGGLGLAAIGFGSYLTILGFQRALITDPLVTQSAVLPSEVRARATREALTVALLGAFGAAGVLALVGVSVRGDIGRALLIVAPWLPALVIQDFWRSVLFRDGRARAAATNDACWLLAMAVTAPLAWSLDSTWLVIGCWGFGGLAGTLLGFAQTRAHPHGARRALRWWRAELWPLGRWLGADSLGYSILSYTTLIVLVSLVGTSGVGGLRAVTTVFAPLTLVGAALALPGLPALSRAYAVSAEAAVRLAFRVGIASAVVTTAYLAVLSIGGGSIIPRVFGHSFRGFTDLVWPVGVGQVIAAFSVGFGLLLKAQRRGSAVLVSTTIGSVAALALVVALGVPYGLLGAAWGFAGASAISLVVTTALALRVRPTVSLVPGARPSS
jgi:O-antigen/teichoic acid export membrane protein